MPLLRPKHDVIKSVTFLRHITCQNITFLRYNVTLRHTVTFLHYNVTFCITSRFCIITSRFVITSRYRISRYIITHYSVMPCHNITLNHVLHHLAVWAAHQGEGLHDWEKNNIRLEFLILERISSNIRNFLILDKFLILERISSNISFSNGVKLEF